MLTPTEIADHLAKVTYKPGWTFSLWLDPWEGPVVRIVAAGLADSYRPGEATDLGVDSFLPPVEDRRDLMRWLGWRLARIEVHEAREFLKYDGQVQYDPHADVRQLEPVIV